MKALSAALLALVINKISAFPAPNDEWPVTVALVNDITGTNASAIFPVDGTERSILSLYGDSDLVVDGVVIASSAVLITYPEKDYVCEIVDGAEVLGIVNAQRKVADLDGDPEVVEPRGLNNAVWRCWWE